MTFLINNSLAFLIVAISLTFTMVFLSFIYELPLYKRGCICYANYETMKKLYSIGPKTGILVLAILLLIYSIVLTCISAVSNVTKINISVYSVTILSSVLIIYFNCQRGKYSQDMSYFDEKHKEISDILSSIDAQKEEYEQSKKDYMHFKDKMFLRANNLQLSSMVELDNQYIFDNFLSDVETQVDKYGNQIENVRNNLINVFNESIKEYISTSNTKIKVVEPDTISLSEQIIKDYIYDAEINCENYFCKEICDRLSITEGTYYHLFCNYTIFDNEASSLENMYAAMLQYSMKKHIKVPELLQSNSSAIVTLYQNVTTNMIETCNSTLRLIITYLKDANANKIYFDNDKIIDYYIELKSTLDEEGLTALGLILTYAIVSVKQDQGVVDSLNALIKKNYKVKDITSMVKKEINNHKQAVVRIVGRLEKTRCMLDCFLQ